MANNKPLVNIGMPVHNGERFIRQALDSLLAQDYENFELIISDNASTDGTQQICLEYTARDERIRYHRNQHNMGAAWNFNRSFELSSGEYFMWFSHDDYCDPGYLRSCLKVFDSLPASVLAGAICESIDSESGELLFTDHGVSTVGLSPEERFVRYKLTVHSGRHIGGIFYGVYKRTALGEVMPMKKVLASDHLLLAELCLHGEFETVQKPLMVKRWGGASTSLRNIARALGIHNRLFTKCPYFVREVLLQRIIFKANQLTPKEKFRLSCWSLINYIRVNGKQALLSACPAWAKRPAKRIRELSRNAVQKR